MVFVCHETEGPSGMQKVAGSIPGISHLEVPQEEDLKKGPPLPERGFLSTLLLKPCNIQSDEETWRARKLAQLFCAALVVPR